MIAARPQASLHPLEIQVLEALYQHRVLTGQQLQEMVFSEWSVQQRSKLIRRLLERGLVRGVLPRQGPSVRRKLRVWYLTELGTQVAESGGVPFGSRRKQMSDTLASGGYQQHTLAVNDVGLAFMRAATERGDDFGVDGWAHEWQVLPQRSKIMPIADARLVYRTEDKRIERFIEVDRATTRPDALAEKLWAYEHVYESLNWQDAYADWPEVLVVFAGSEEGRHRSRMKEVTGLYLARSEQRMGLSFVTLPQLRSSGPWSRVVSRVNGGLRWTDWLGEA